MTQASLLVDALWAPSRPALRNTVLVLAGSALIGLGAHISVPMWPVPITMQTFAVLLIGLAFGPYLAAATVAAYLVEGMAGLPMFSAGPATIVGPTAGYLVGYLPAAALVGLLAGRGYSRPVLGVALAMLVGSLVIYALGAAWLATFVGVQKAWTLGVLPFLLGDVLKAALAATLVPAVWRLVARR